jgi:hypothetical protein
MHLKKLSLITKMVKQHSPVYDFSTITVKNPEEIARH